MRNHDEPHGFLHPHDVSIHKTLSFPVVRQGASSANPSRYPGCGSPAARRWWHSPGDESMPTAGQVVQESWASQAGAPPVMFVGLKTPMNTIYIYDRSTIDHREIGVTGTNLAKYVTSTTEYMNNLGYIIVSKKCDIWFFCDVLWTCWKQGCLNNIMYNLYVYIYIY